MSYIDLLNNAIKEKGYSKAYITRECNNLGCKMDASYLSRLCAGTNIPSEEISKALGTILDIDYRLLIVEGYIDKAPQIILDCLKSIQEITYINTINAFRNKVTTEVLNELREEFRKTTLAQLLIELLDDNQYKVSMVNNNIQFENVLDDMIINVMQPKEIPVTDNAMSPFITMDNNVTLEMKTEYQTGDILAVNIKGEKGYIIRQATLLENEIILSAIDKKTKDVRHKKEDIVIIGRVCRIVTEI